MLSTFVRCQKLWCGSGSCCFRSLRGDTKCPWRCSGWKLKPRVSQIDIYFVLFSHPLNCATFIWWKNTCTENSAIFKKHMQAGDLFEGNVKDDDFGKVVSISGVSITTTFSLQDFSTRFWKEKDRTCGGQCHETWLFFDISLSLSASFFFLKIVGWTKLPALERVPRRCVNRGSARWRCQWTWCRGCLCLSAVDLALFQFVEPVEDVSCCPGKCWQTMLLGPKKGWDKMWANLSFVG